MNFGQWKVVEFQFRLRMGTMTYVKVFFDILADGHSSDQLYELNFYSVFDKLNFVCING